MLIDTPILRLSRRQQIAASEIQIRYRCQNINFTVVLGHSAQSGFMESKLLFDDTKWVLNLGPDVRLLQAEACG